MSTEERIREMRDQFAERAANDAYGAAWGKAQMGFDLDLDMVPTESPIERLLVAQMLAEKWCLMKLSPSSPKPILSLGATQLIALCEPQRHVALDGKRYRADFMFLSGLLIGRKYASNADRARAGRAASVFVELDGHAFHERTKEQASADRKRDRAFASAGLTVIRFTGSDVYRDPAAVLAEIVSLAHSNAKARK